MFYHELNSQGKLSQTINEFVFQDSRGFTWISSIDGLNRYDGINVEVYKTNKSKNSIQGHNIQSGFFEDKEGNIWFCTYEAINCYRPESNDFLHHQLDIKGEKINTDYHIFHFEKGSSTLWVKIGEAIYTFDTQQKIFTKTDIQGPLGLRFLVWENKKSGKVESIWTWSFIDSTLVEIYPGRKVRLQPIVNYDRVIQKAIIQNPDSLWVLTSLGLNCASRQGDGQFLSRLITPPGLMPGVIPLSMLAIGSGKLLLWLSDGSLATYHISHNRILRRWYLHAFNPLVRSEAIGRNMYLDPQDNIWLSIPGLGLRYANLSRKTFEFISLTTPGSQEKIKIEALGMLNNGTLLFVDKHERLKVYVPETGFIEPQNVQILKDHVVYAIVIDAQDYAYLFTLNAIFVYNSKKNWLDKLSGNTLNLMTATKLKNGQVLGTTYPSLQLMNWQLAAPHASRPIKGLEKGPQFFNNIFQDRMGTVYLPFNDQHILAGKLIRDSFVLSKKIEIKGTVNGYYSDPRQDKIWIATSYGLFIVNTKNWSWKTVLSKDRSTQQYILGMLPDPNGQLWLSTHNGLFRFDHKTGKSKRFDVIDGLPDIEFLSRAGILCADGKMLFGTRNGLVYFDPMKVSPLKYAPKVVLLEFKANNENKDSLQKTLRQGTIKLPFRSAISFRFQGIEYSDPQNIQLSYYMYPQEKQWINLSNTQGSVRYAELPAGQYTLRLRATSANGVLSKEELRYTIIIAKPFYQTIVFIIGALLGMAILVYALSKLLARRQLNTQRKKQVLLEEERNRMMEDLHDGIGFDLTAIKAISEKSMLVVDDQKFKEQFEKVFTRTQDAIRTMGEVFKATDEQYSSLGGFFDWVQEKVTTFSQDLEMSLSIIAPVESLETTIGPEARQNLWLVIKETLNNMAKHADATQVNLIFKASKNQVIIEIQDNGKGFDPETLRKGRGMRNMPKRMRNIGGSFEVLPQAQGTLVKLSAPISSIPAAKRNIFSGVKK
ncbi:sensor histidine kinase [Haliscomenobacter hydrossis]|uniref:sensor histidine kinase n=1 Tax=Haliscomenobacter hydrossis TaxID=2350 RepID=UPI00145F846A|nr:sensor histidine kinase [Haliscomenobacter hydrossis]